MDLLDRTADLDGAPAGPAVDRVVLTDGTAAMIWYRLTQWARRWRLVPLELLFNRVNTFDCNCIIGRGAEFGPGPGSSGR